MCDKYFASPPPLQVGGQPQSRGADQDAAIAVADQDTAAAVADQDTAMAVADLVLRREAIEWATNSKYHSFIANLVDTLPPAVLDEQVRLHQASKCVPVVPHAPQAVVVYPHLLKSRQEAAQFFDTELRKAGWAPGTRLPRASATKAAEKLVLSKTTTFVGFERQGQSVATLAFGFQTDVC